MGYTLSMTSKKSSQLCIKIEPEIHDKLLKIAAAEDRSVGYVIRKMIEEGIARLEGQEAGRAPSKKRA